MTRAGLAPTLPGVLRRPAVRLLALALLYVAAVVLGRAARLEGTQLSLAWPAAGVATVWLLASRPGRERRWSVAGLAAATAAANIATGLEVVASVAFGAVNAVHALVAVAVLARRGWTVPRPLTHVRDVTSLGAAALAGALASGTTGAALAAWRLDADALSSASLLVPRNTVSTFVVVAALLSLHPLLTGRWLSEGPAGPVERRVVPVGVVVLAPLLLLVAHEAPVGFLLLPLTVLAAVRTGVGPTALLVLMQGGLVVLQATQGGGPFATTLSSTQRVLFVQCFLAVIAVVGLYLALAERERALALAQAGATRDRLQAHVDGALVGQAILGVEADGLRVLSANPALGALLARPAASLTGTDGALLLCPQDRERVRPHVRDVLAGRAAGWHGELRLQSTRGAVWVDAALGLVPTLDGSQDRHLSAQFLDVTARKQAEERLSHLALHDELTGLPNRALWRDRTQQALAAVVRTGAHVGVMYVDVDHFKAINDNHGHEVGDQVLVAVAQRLRSAVRPQDTVARLGGDEFVVVCPEIADDQTLTSLGERLIEALRPPLNAGGHRLLLTASIGTTLSHPLDDDPQRVLHRADLALYEAKHRGRARVRAYDEQAEDEAVRTRVLLDGFARALDADELVLHYQPIVDMASGQVTGLEALVRWQHPTRGLLAPSHWLDVIESSAFIHRLGDFALEQACRDHATLLAEGHLGLTMHVNVSARQLERPGTADKVERALRESGVPAGQLVLELTETRLLAVHGSLLGELHAIRRLGVELAVDDFGTGFSTLAHLVEMPIDILKLDRSFVAGLGTQRSAHAISAGVIAMARGLGVRCVAEGVEEQAQADALREMGYTSAQGYLWAPPAPLAQVRDSLSKPPQRPASASVTRARRGAPPLLPTS